MELDWASVVNAALIIVTMILGAGWKGAKSKSRETVSLVSTKANQAIDLVNTLMDVIEDNNISPEEEQKVVGKYRLLVPKKEI